VVMGLPDRWTPILECGTPETLGGAGLPPARTAIQTIQVTGVANSRQPGATGRDRERIAGV
jgi:hypothetical protein